MIKFWEILAQLLKLATYRNFKLPSTNQLYHTGEITYPGTTFTTIKTIWTSIRHRRNVLIKRLCILYLFYFFNIYFFPGFFLGFHPDFSHIQDNSPIYIGSYAYLVVPVIIYINIIVAINHAKKKKQKMCKPWHQGNLLMHIHLHHFLLVS